MSSLLAVVIMPIWSLGAQTYGSCPERFGMHLTNLILKVFQYADPQYLTFILFYMVKTQDLNALSLAPILLILAVSLIV